MHTKDKHSVKLVEDNLQSDEEWGRVGCAVCADDKLFGGKRCCGTFGDKSPFHYEHKFQQKASFSNMIYYIPWFYRLFKRRSDILLVWKNARISDISKFWAFGFANLVTVEKNMEGVAWKHSKIRLVDTSHKNVETVGAEHVALQPRHHFRMCRRQVGRWWLPAPRIGSSGLMLRSPPYVRSKIKIKIDTKKQRFQSCNSLCITKDIGQIERNFEDNICNEVDHLLDCARMVWVGRCCIHSFCLLLPASQAPLPLPQVPPRCSSWRTPCQKASLTVDRSPDNALLDPQL